MGSAREPAKRILSPTLWGLFDGESRGAERNF
jgi:hypothetical protein